MSETETNPVEETESSSEQSAQGEAQVVDAVPEEAQAADDGLEADPGRAERTQLEQELAKTRDQLLRTAADFENYRRRARKDVEDAQRKGLERALLELLPVADNLERALSAADTTADVKAVVEGVGMVLRSFSDSFERLGVERVSAKGEGFDPNVHEAIQQVPTSEATPGTVVAELLPGYRLNGKLLRAAMVSVAVPDPAATDASKTVDAEPGTNVQSPERADAPAAADGSAEADPGPKVDG